VIFKRFCLALAALMWIVAAAPASEPDPDPVEAAAPPPKSEAGQILSLFISQLQAQQARLRDMSMEMEIEARLPRLKKEGSLRAIRQISPSGEVQFLEPHPSGDKMIYKDVIGQYLKAETEASRGIKDSRGNPVSIAINTENYRFRHKATISSSGRRIYVYQVTPRKKRLGLFRGEVWVDASSGMPLREAGRLIKTPSVFLKKVEFVREYEIQDGVALPVRVESIIDTRLVGRAELEIRYSNYSSIQAAGQTMSAMVQPQ